MTSPATGRCRTTDRERWRHRSSPAAGAANGSASEAEGHLGRALELWDSVNDADALAGLDHPALLVETAIAAEHAHHFERGIELDLQAVAELAGVDPTREAEVWLQLRDLYRFLNRWDDCAVTSPEPSSSSPSHHQQAPAPKHSPTPRSARRCQPHRRGRRLRPPSDRRRRSRW